MFLRSHSPRIDIHIRIDFDSSDLQSGGFEQ